MAEDMFKIVEEEVSKVDCESGGFNSGHLWKLKSKLRPKFNDKPTAMVDSSGRIVTSVEEIKSVHVTHFEKFLENRPIKSGLEEQHKLREKFCFKRINNAKLNKTTDWDIEDVKFVITNLKKKKSCDPLVHSNELFQMPGSDFTCAVLKGMNRIKDQQTFPQCIQKYNITSIYKNKGSRKDLNCYRGIFRATVLRSILDRLIVNDEYEGIDRNLTDSNVEGRRGRNIRNNIYVLNAIINSVTSGKGQACDITVHDVENALMHYGIKNASIL